MGEKPVARILIDHLLNKILHFYIQYIQYITENCHFTISSPKNLNEVTHIQNVHIQTLVWKLIQTNSYMGSLIVALSAGFTDSFHDSQ